MMTDQSYHVYVIQGRGQRDYSDCQAALAHVPARMTALPFLGTEDEVIAKTRDADALDDGHASGPTVKDPAAAGTIALIAQQHPHIHAEHGARQCVIPRQEVAKPVRQTQHPLAHWPPRQHLVDEARGGLGHAPAATVFDA